VHEPVKSPYRTGCEVPNRLCQLKFLQNQGSTLLITEVVLDQVAYEHEARSIKSLKI